MRKKLSVAGKQYTKQDGTQGTEWTNVGVLNVSQNGKEYVLLDPKINLAALPVGDNGMVMVSVVIENQNNQNNQQQGNQGQQNQNNQQQQQKQQYPQGYGNQQQYPPQQQQR